MTGREDASPEDRPRSPVGRTRPPLTEVVDLAISDEVQTFRAFSDALGDDISDERAYILATLTNCLDEFDGPECPEAFETAHSSDEAYDS